MEIEVSINGRKEMLAANTTVADILESKDVRPEIVAVEINGELIQKSEYSKLTLAGGDKMEFLHYMAGGGAMSLSKYSAPAANPVCRPPALFQLFRVATATRHRCASPVDSSSEFSLSSGILRQAPGV